MNPIVNYAQAVENHHLLGRVFIYDDNLHYVVDIDQDSRLFKVSCRYGERTEFCYLTVDEVRRRISTRTRKGYRPTG